MKLLKRLILLATITFLSLPVSAQNEPITIEPELGEIGADFLVLNDEDVDYVTINATVGGGNPSTAARVVTMTAEFPAPGTYNLYMRLRVGSNPFNDDSFFYANGFGARDPANDQDWILTNNLAIWGYVAGGGEAVLGGGTAADGVWKWLQLSAFDGGEPPVQFVVPEGELVQTFQIGGREDGLDIDKFVFGRDGVFFSVNDLDNGLPGTAPPPPPPFEPPGPPMALGKSKFVGSVYSNSQAVNFDKYFNQVTPENAGKWGSVEGTRDVMNWAELDAAYALARDNGFPFRFHTLVWGAQQPAWIETLSPEEQLEEIQEWFTAVADRYPDIDFIDVVNEPLHDPPNQPGNGGGNYIEALGGNGTTGWDWVINTFKLARMYFPSSELTINDFSIVNTPSSVVTYLEIIDLLLADDLIDAIGVQGHAFSTRGDNATMIQSLDSLATRGLPIYVTELDIDGPTDEIQLADYQRIFPMFWEHPAVQGITLWGYRPGHWRTAQGAYIAHENGAERPALVWLQAYVRNNPPVIPDGQVFTVSEAAMPGDNILGFVDAIDEDGDSPSGWHIAGGTGAGLFSIDPMTGDLSLADGTSLDFETTISYTLDVTTRDEYTGSAATTVLIDVLNENDNAPVIDPQSFKIDQGSDNIISTVTATDADDTNAEGYTVFQQWQIVGGNGKKIFSIDADSGEISLAGKQIHPNKKHYTLDVTVSDGANSSNVGEIRIFVPHKVKICHLGHTKSVSIHAVNHFLKHGATLGKCDEPRHKPHHKFKWWHWWKWF
jgi:endo-1,4-beta-xylanase